MKGQLARSGSGSAIANGIASVADVIDLRTMPRSRSTLLRRAAFHPACRTAAPSTRAITSGVTGSDQSVHRAGRIAVVLLGHAAGQVGFAAGFDGELHRTRHAYRVLCVGDTGVGDDGVAAKFHR